MSCRLNFPFQSCVVILEVSFCHMTQDHILLIREQALGLMGSDSEKFSTSWNACSHFLGLDRGWIAHSCLLVSYVDSACLQEGLNPFALAVAKKDDADKPATSFEKVMDLVVRAPCPKLFLLYLR